MFAIINGALIQTIMASRVLYGLSSRGHIHSSLSQVHHVTRTPLIATLLVGSLIFTFAIFGKLATLAETTSMIMLVIFSLINLSLLRIKMRETHRPEGIFSIPFWLPVLGFLVSSGFVLSQIINAVW